VVRYLLFVGLFPLAERKKTNRCNGKYLAAAGKAAVESATAHVLFIESNPHERLLVQAACINTSGSASILLHTERAC